MKISVLTVCWNVEKTLRYTLDSFFAQDHADKEIVIVDGASKDATMRIAEEYRSPQMIALSESDKGMYDALNKGKRLYTGDAFGVLNADDCFHDKTILSRVSEALTDADAVFGDLDFVADHQTKRVMRRWRGAPKPKSGFRLGWMPAHPTFYVRRSLAAATGDFDISYKIAADYDWMLRALELQRARTTYLSHTMIDMMVGGMSTSNLKAKYTIASECLRARQKWLGSGFVDAALFGKPIRQLRQIMSLPSK
jgi:glycosyltransferase involved in cell wall biosynthesis